MCLSEGEENQSGVDVGSTQISQARFIIFIAECFNWNGGYQLLKYKSRLGIFVNLIHMTVCNQQAVGK